MRHLETSNNPEAKNIIEKATEKANDSKTGSDILCLAIQSNSALNDEDKFQTFRDLAIILMRMRESNGKMHLKRNFMI